MSLLNAALHYAENNISVFPVHGIHDNGGCTCGNPTCPHPGKHPIYKGGFKIATTDAQDIITWWRKHPQANIGVPTGELSGWYVVDVDQKHQGIQNYTRFVDQWGDSLPKANLVSNTGGGGYHLIYGKPLDGQSVGCGTNIGGLEGVDFRGDGGYIVAPPSLHISQQPYAWAVDRDFTDAPKTPLQPLPPAIIHLLRHPGGAAGAHEAIKSGSRNNTLFKRACQLRREGIEDDALFQTLQAINQRQCQPPLEADEVRAIAASALNRDIAPHAALTPGAATDANDAQKSGAKSKEAFERLMAIANGHTFWLDEQRRAYATFSVEDALRNGVQTVKHFENWPILSRQYQMQLALEYKRLHQKAPPAKTVVFVTETLAGDVLFEAPIYKTCYRVARHDDRIFVDLADDAWSVVEISAQQWRVHHDPVPVKFLRAPHTKPMWIPDPTGTLDSLRQVFRLRHEDEYVLLAAWMMFTFVESGPFPILTIEGVAGSSKSTLTRHIRQLLDPCRPDIQMMPRKIDDLFVQASHSHLLAYDNVSKINQELSDTLCTIATHSGSVKRQLFTDDTIFVMEVCKPILINSINPVVEFSDLADRCLRLTLTPITNHAGERRLSAETLEQRFQAWAPKILGALFNALQRALANYRRIKQLPAEIRMADFAAWAIAAGELLAPGERSFLSIFMANRRFNALPFLEQNVLCMAVQKLMHDHPHRQWRGNATALYQALKRHVSNDDFLDSTFPKRPNTLTRELNQSITILKQFGIEYIPPDGNNHKNRIITINYTPLPMDAAGDILDSDSLVTWLDEAEVATERGANEAVDRAAGDLSADDPSWIDQNQALPRYRVIDSVEDAVRAITEMAAGGTLIGFDLETTGLNPRQDDICLMQLFDGQRAVIIDVRNGMDWTALKSALESSRLVAHNAVFDMAFLAAQGIHLAMDCTLLAHHVLTGDCKSLQDLAAHYLDRALDKTEQSSDWRATLSEAQWAYAANDAAAVWSLFNVLQDKLAERESVLAYRRVRDAQPFEVAMHLNGMAFDAAGYRTMLQTLTAEHEALRREWFEREPEVNYASAQQLSGWIGRSLLDPDADWPLTDTGQYSSKAKDLQVHASHLRPEAECLTNEVLLPLKKREKLITAFGDKLLDTIDPVTGRIHATFNLAGAVTGRMSCAKPNLQQVPRQAQYRRMFTAAEGCRLVIADYSQMELRIAAILAEEHTLLAAYAQGQDTHRLTAALLLGKEPEEVTPEERQLAKAVNFGLLYGQSPQGLQAYAAGSYGVRLDISLAQAYRDAWFESYPAFARWHHLAYKRARQAMMVSTPSGRKRYFASTEYKHSQGLKRAVVYNTPVQGGGAEVLQEAMARVMDNIVSGGYSDAIKPVAVIHDEIILEARQDCAEAAKQLLESAMVDAMLAVFPDASTRDLVEAHIGDTWADK